MHIEAKRVEDERRSHALREANQERARREAEAQRIADEAARALAEDERRRLEARLRREEEAHREALKVAAIERARTEAMARSHIETMALAQQHERQLLELRNDVDKRRLRRNIVTIAVVSVISLGSVLGGYFGKIRPDGLARAAALQADADRKGLEAQRLEREAHDREEKLRALDRERAAIAATPIVVKPAPVPVTPSPRPIPTTKPTEIKHCNKLDPIAECL